MDHQEFVGRQFPTRKGSTITVISFVGSRSGSLRYLVSCSDCHEDRELFPDLIETSKSELNRGGAPCGCAPVHRYQRFQYEILAERHAKKKGLSFLGFVDPYTGSSSKCKLSCKKHGEWSSTTFVALARDCGCPTCSLKKNSDGRTQDDKSLTSDLVASGVIPRGAIIKRLPEKDSTGRVRKCDYFCPACSVDEYSTHLLSNGWFKSQIGDLKRGILPCRCAPNYRWSKKEREYQISKSLGALSFVGWQVESIRPNNASKIILSCVQHGKFIAGLETFINVGTSCPGCAQKGFDQTAEGYVYALRSNCGGYIKVGISNYPDERISSLARVTPFGFTQEAEIRFDRGEHARKLEKETHSAFMRAGLSGFDGATEWLRYDSAIIEYIQQRAM